MMFVLSLIQILFLLNYIFQNFQDNYIISCQINFISLIRRMINDKIKLLTRKRSNSHTKTISPRKKSISPSCQYDIRYISPKKYDLYLSNQRQLKQLQSLRLAAENQRIKKQIITLRNQKTFQTTQNQKLKNTIKCIRQDINNLRFQPQLKSTKHFQFEQTGISFENLDKGNFQINEIDNRVSQMNKMDNRVSQINEIDNRVSQMNEIDNRVSYKNLVSNPKKDIFLEECLMNSNIKIEKLFSQVKSANMQLTTLERKLNEKQKEIKRLRIQSLTDRLPMQKMKK